MSVITVGSWVFVWCIILWSSDYCVVFSFNSL